MIKIDDAVPVKRRWMYPIRELEVSQSFFTAAANENSIRVICSRRGRELGRKFRVSKVLENGTPGIRVWRME